MSDPARWELLVKRDDLAVTEVREVPAPELAEGQVELAVEQLAVTMNNVAYAQFGDPPLNFWKAFPTDDEAWGRLPVWGFVRVTRSRLPGFAEGDRFFGMLPAGSHHVVRPGDAPYGFLDGTPERQFPVPWYHTYQPAGEPDSRDDRRTLLRPVYPASFHAAAVIAARGPVTALVTSASSKVAIGTAHRLRGDADVRTVGLTSPSRTGFVAGLGLYDDVVAYPDVASLAIEGPVLVLDLAGDGELLATIHGTFREQLTYVGLGGWTHGAQPPPELTDPEPESFFAPAVEAATIEAEGVDAFFARYHAAEDEFLDATRSWLTITHDSGPDAVAAVFRGLLDGSHPTDTATVLRP